MAVGKVFNMIFFLALIGIVAAVPGFGYGDSSAVKCSTNCQAYFSRCLSGERGLEFCRDLVCESYTSKCVGCEPCNGNKPATFDFTAAIDASETSNAIIKREPQADKPAPYCILMCHHAGCRRHCFNAAEELPKDLKDALVINEESVNGTISIKFEVQAAGDPPKKPSCVHWVCVFRNCWYVECNEANAEEIAGVQTSASTGDPKALASGCRKVCKDDVVRDVCITLCPPNEPPSKLTQDVNAISEKDIAVSGPPDIILWCEWKLQGHYRYIVCYPKKPNLAVAKRQDNPKGGRCNTVCWNGPMCFVYCGDGNAPRKREVEASSTSACEPSCPNTNFNFMCIMMCREGYQGYKEISS